ncbi:MAG: zinc metallopeptidase [candidate division Zixibacteria bacterium]|nr:zinc metallopeptidase [candidate division Zixibacteria bacterium]
MKWQGRRTSDNVEDRRGISGKGMAVGGGVGGILIVLLFMILGGNPDEIMQSVQQPGLDASLGMTQPLSEQERQEGEFVGVILAETEDVWHRIFQQNGSTYREPRLVLFTDQISSACGYAGGASGPFYCPGDERVYIDLGFFKEMQTQLGASGDFALAYVIAHEVGHHVQTLLGINDDVMAQRDRLSEVEFNRLMVRMELQADFLAGVWAHHAERTANLLEQGDIEEGINAAGAVGDDRIMKQTQGYVVPDAFTHGTSEQRVRWFLKGYQTGDISQGDTFNADRL